MSALKQVFVRVPFRYAEDRYAEDLEQFAAWLLGAGYPNKSARTHLFRVKKALRAIGAPPGSTLNENAIQRAFRRLARRCWKQCHTRKIYAGYLRPTNRLIEPHPSVPDPLAELIQEFCDRLISQRGLAASTIAGYRYWIGDFLGRSLQPGQLLRNLVPDSLETYILRRGPTMAATTLRNAIKCIQAFLKDAFERRRLPQRIDLIDLPRGFRPERPPRALPWPLVEKLLASIDRKDRTGCRDFTMLHLMAHYGLRTGELTHLTLDSINWNAQTLTVWQPKTRSTLVLPLHRRTVKILTDYLATARPKADLPWLFLSGVAPLAPMTKHSASAMFKTRARRSGLPIAHHSSYCLRHGFAQRLFQQGVGMKAIGDLMGHRNLISTGVYLRLQSSMLREVALPVPGFDARVGGGV